MKMQFPFNIKIDNLDGPEVAALLEEHLGWMRSVSPPESAHALDLEELRQPSRETCMLLLAIYCAGRNSDASSILSLLTFGFPYCFWLAKAHSELHDRSDDKHSLGILSTRQHHRRPATHSRGSEVFLGESSNGSLLEDWMRTRFHRNCRVN